MFRSAIRLENARLALVASAEALDPSAATTALAELQKSSDLFEADLTRVADALKEPAGVEGAGVASILRQRHADYISDHRGARQRMVAAAEGLAGSKKRKDIKRAAEILLALARDDDPKSPERTITGRRVRRTAPRYERGRTPELSRVEIENSPSTPQDQAATADFPADAIDIKSLAVAGNAAQTAKAVRSRLILVPHHGATAGALGCVRTRACSAVDAASALVAALRAAGIPSRLRYGTVSVDKSAMGWISGARTSKAAAGALSLGGVPALATERGVIIEHFWAAAWIAGKWVNLDPTYPNTPQPAPIVAGKSRPIPFFKQYLRDPSDRTPAALLPLGKSQQWKTRPRAAYRILWSADLSAVPEAFRESIWVQVSDESSVKIPMPAVLGTGVALVPAFAADIEQALDLLFGDAAPAYLRRSRLDVRAGGKTWGTLPPNAVPGTLIPITLTIPAPGSVPQNLSTIVSAGSAAAITVVVQPVEPAFANSRWHADVSSTSRLSAAGAVLFSALIYESRVHGVAANGVVAIGPSAAVASAGLSGIRALTATPVRTRADGIRMDVARMDQVLLSHAKTSDPAGFAARSGAALSAWEARSVEIAFGLPAVSAVGAIKSAAGAGIMPVRINARAKKLPPLKSLSQVSRDELRQAVGKGRTAFVAPQPVRRAAWAGESYVLVDARSGRGAFIVRGRLDGAVTGDRADAFVQAARKGKPVPKRREDARRAGRTAAAYEGWPDLWTPTSEKRPLVGVDALLTHAEVLAGQARASAVALPADPADLASGTVVDLGALGHGIALGEVDIVLPKSAAPRQPLDGYVAATRRYTGAAVLVSIRERSGVRRITALPAALLPPKG